MTGQDFLDFIDREIIRETQKLIEEHPESSVHLLKKLRSKLIEQLKKETKDGMAKR